MGIWEVMEKFETGQLARLLLPGVVVLPYIVEYYKSSAWYSYSNDVFSCYFSFHHPVVAPNPNRCLCILSRRES